MGRVKISREQLESLRNELDHLRLDSAQRATLATLLEIAADAITTAGAMGTPILVDTEDDDVVERNASDVREQFDRAFKLGVRDPIRTPPTGMIIIDGNKK